MMRPWLDRQNRFSPLKAFVFVGVLLPALWVLGRLWLDLLGPKPINAAIHETGLWAVRLLLLTLLVTPLRLISGQTRIVLVRRMLGVASLGYTLLHLFLYVVESKYDLWFVAREIVLRFYLTIGFLSLAALIALGITSTDGAIRRMGAERWNKLHKLVYPLTVLALIHAFLQAKIDVSEGVIMAGVFLGLMLARAMRRRIAFTPLALVALALIATILTAGLEAAWYALKSGAPAMRVLAANLDPDLAFRPASIVLLIGLLLPMIAWIAPRFRAASV